MSIPDAYFIIHHLTLCLTDVTDVTDERYRYVTDITDGLVDIVIPRIISTDTNTLYSTGFLIDLKVFTNFLHNLCNASIVIFGPIG
jgi:hypothetical protein